MSAAAAAAAAAAACCSSRNSSHASKRSSHSHSHNSHSHQYYSIAESGGRGGEVVVSRLGSRYETQKRREWMSFMEYMRERHPELSVSGCSGGDVVEFLKFYFDDDGDGDDDDQNKNNRLVGAVPHQKLYWGSVEALIGRLRAAFEEMGSGQARTTTNPFVAPVVRLYLRQLKDAHAHHHHHHHQQQQQLYTNFNVFQNYL